MKEYIDSDELMELKDSFSMVELEQAEEIYKLLTKDVKKPEFVIETTPTRGGWLPWKDLIKKPGFKETVWREYPHRMDYSSQKTESSISVHNMLTREFDLIDNNKHSDFRVMLVNHFSKVTKHTKVDNLLMPEVLHRTKHFSKKINPRKKEV